MIKINRSSIKSILLVVLLICFMVSLGVNSCQRQKNKTYENNIEVLQDTVRVLQLRNEELLYSKNSLILEKNELQKYLDISNAERKELERKLNSKISNVSVVSTTVKTDTIVMRDTLTADSCIQFHYNDEWLVINGNTVLNTDGTTTTINELSIDVPLTVGYTKDNLFFATTPNPYVSIIDVKSATLNKQKPKHWNIGLQAGFGAQYGLITNTIDVGPYIGLGISYGFSF